MLVVTGLNTRKCFTFNLCFNHIEFLFMTHHTFNPLNFTDCLSLSLPLTSAEKNRCSQEVKCLDPLAAISADDYI